MIGKVDHPKANGSFCISSWGRLLFANINLKATERQTKVRGLVANSISGVSQVHETGTIHRHGMQGITVTPPRTQ